MSRRYVWTPSKRESNLPFFGGFSDFRYYDLKQFRRFCQHSTSFLRVFSSKQVECSANPAQVFCKRSASVSPDSSTSQQYSSELLSRQKLPRIFLPLVTSLFVADRFSTTRIGTAESKTAFLSTRETFFSDSAIHILPKYRKIGIRFFQSISMRDKKR